MLQVNWHLNVNLVTRLMVISLARCHSHNTAVNVFLLKTVLPVFLIDWAMFRTNLCQRLWADEEDRRGQGREAINPSTTSTRGATSLSPYRSPVPTSAASASTSWAPLCTAWWRWWTWWSTAWCRACAAGQRWSITTRTGCWPRFWLPARSTLTLLEWSGDNRRGFLILVLVENLNTWTTWTYKMS